MLTDNFVIWAATRQNQQNECAPSEDSAQPGHPPSLIRVFAVRMKKAGVLSHPQSEQQRLWSDWADAQADLSLRWAHTHFVGFVMSRLIWFQWSIIPRGAISKLSWLLAHVAEQLTWSHYSEGRLSLLYVAHMSRLMTLPTKWLCAQRRLSSAWVSAQSDLSLCCALNG